MSVKNNKAIIKAGAPVTDTLATIEKLFDSLQKIQDTPWKTNGDFGNGFPNIKETGGVLVPIETLITIESHAFGMDKTYTDSMIRLGYTTAPQFKHNGYPYADWHHDIKLRGAIDRQAAQYNKLKKLQEDGKKFISEAEQKALWEKEVLLAAGEMEA